MAYLRRCIGGEILEWHQLCCPEIEASEAFCKNWNLGTVLSCIWMVNLYWYCSLLSCASMKRQVWFWAGIQKYLNRDWLGTCRDQSAPLVGAFVFWFWWREFRLWLLLLHRGLAPGWILALHRHCWERGASTALCTNLKLLTELCRGQEWWIHIAARWELRSSGTPRKEGGLCPRSVTSTKGRGGCCCFLRWPNGQRLVCYGDQTTVTTGTGDPSTGPLCSACSGTARGAPAGTWCRGRSRRMVQTRQDANQTNFLCLWICIKGHPD